MTEFKVSVYMELDFLHLPDAVKVQLEKMLMDLKTKQTNSRMKIDVEKVEK